MDGLLWMPIEFPLAWSGFHVGYRDRLVVVGAVWCGVQPKTSTFILNPFILKLNFILKFNK